jgi:hypothetical protein
MAMPNPCQPKLPDYYGVLGVDYNATADEVSQAFRQRARDVHPDKVTDANLNDWHLLHKAYTTLMDGIQRQDYNEKLASEGTDEEPDYTRLALPTTVRLSEEFKRQFSQWAQLRNFSGSGGFIKAFHPELGKILNECCQDLATGANIDYRKKNRRIERGCNFEEMMSSIAETANLPTSSPVIQCATEHLVCIIRAAQTNKRSLIVTGGQIPILDLSGSPVKDLLFLLNLFTEAEVDGTQPTRGASTDDIKRRLMSYIPVRNVHVGMLKTESNGRCGNCGGSTSFFSLFRYNCTACEQRFCRKCPTTSMKAPRIGINAPQPMCHGCIKRLALKDAEDWSEKALTLMRTSSLKAAMACVLIAIHTTEVLPLAQLRAVANELLKQGLQEQALVILSVLWEVSGTKKDVKVCLPAIKALQQISCKPGKALEEKWLLMLTAQHATLLAKESIANSSIDVPGLAKTCAEITESIADFEHKKETEFKALVNTYLSELERAWMSRDLPEMVKIATSTEILHEEVLVFSNGIEPAVKALEMFLDARKAYIPKMMPDDQCTLKFFQGFTCVCSGKPQMGLELMEKAVWSGHHNRWLSGAVIPIVISEMEKHPSITNDMVKVGKEILQNGPSRQICFSSLLHVLGITEEDLSPSLKSCWPELSVPGINQGGTRRYEKAVYQQVQDQKLDYCEAGYAMIDFVLGACHPAEMVVCLLNASLWFLKALRGKKNTYAQIYALKMVTLKCVQDAHSAAYLGLHPGMQFYVARHGLAIATEAIITAGKCAMAEDSHLIVELFNAVVQKGRFCPLWKMPIVPVCEAVLLNILSGRLHTEFMLQLQKKENSGLLKPEEVRYQLYENDLWWVCRVEDKDATRERAMEAIMETKGLTWSDISDSMCSALNPRTPDGWLLQQTHLGGNVPFATLKGFEFNIDSDHPFIKLTAIPAGHSKQGLFSGADVHTVLQIPKEDLFPIIFSLDPPNDAQRFHPFQQLRFEPSSLENTDLLHTLLQTDYLMKCFSVGSDVSAKPPFLQRDCSEGLTANLPPRLKKILAPISERGSCRNKTSRFWIQADEIQYNIEQNGSLVRCRIGEVKMVVRTMPQFPGLDGKLHDIKDEDPDSPESQFARDLTENYDEISKYFPTFGRLRELCKLQILGVFLGSILEDMQSKANGEGVTIPPSLYTTFKQRLKERMNLVFKKCFMK